MCFLLVSELQCALHQLRQFAGLESAVLAAGVQVEQQYPAWIAAHEAVCFLYLTCWIFNL